MKRRELLAAFAAGAGIATGAAFVFDPSRVFAQARGGSAVSEAEAFISNLMQQGISSLTGRGTAEAERARRFHDMLYANFDVPTIARFVIGRYWRLASAQEQQEYLNLFGDMLVGMYASRFGDYQGELPRVTGSRSTSEGDIFVTSDLVRPGQPQPLRLEWVLRRAGSSFKIVDLRVEGVSMAVTQRDEFGSIIQRGGGQISSLLTVMRQRAAAAAH
jgi:phospholipid transport system substrate-binding protein